MNKTIFPVIFLLAVPFIMTSCQNDTIEHIGETRLVILQQVPRIENKFDENFRAMLELLYPHVCHDTAFIQDRIFLERIDLSAPYTREFIIPQSLVRDFFGSNNPDKKRALREELFYLSDSSFEKNPGKQFLTDSPISHINQSKAIGAYLMRNRNNAMVYLISSDTLHKKYETGGVSREVWTDFARLNCKIVADLRKKSKEELLNTTVILVAIPPEIIDTTANPVRPDTICSPKKHNISKGRVDPASRTEVSKRAGSHCPPDSVVNRINKKRTSIMTEFRNLLHYIATTQDDADLKAKYKEDAYSEIHKIPQVTIDGIPDHDLRKFLNSGFSRNVAVSPVTDHCGVIAGIRISER
jgi:hypothetical protein